MSRLLYFSSSGDIGMEDEEGFLFIVDRLKELIKYKAFQVAPATLEDILLRHEAVADVGVIGVPDEECGELPRAYVLKKAGKEICEKDLQDFVAGLSCHFHYNTLVTRSKKKIENLVCYFARDELCTLLITLANSLQSD